MVAVSWWFVCFVRGFGFGFLSTLVMMAGDWFLVLALDFGLLVVAMVFGWSI